MPQRNPEPACLRCRSPNSAIGRRTALAGAVGLLSTGVAARSSFAQIPSDAERARPQAGDVLVKMVGDDRRPLTVADLPVGDKPIIAWPFDPATGTLRSASRLNKVLVLRLDPEGFDEPTRADAADGVLAYSAICPHTGCEVANWQAEAQILECPCHFSHYDPKAGAKVLSGPSPRRLAALPLSAAEGGKLVVAKPFTGRVGVQQQT
jgi:Rieske Fe-S protein